MPWQAPLERKWSPKKGHQKRLVDLSSRVRTCSQLGRRISREGMTNGMYLRKRRLPSSVMQMIVENFREFRAIRRWMLQWSLSGGFVGVQRMLVSWNDLPRCSTRQWERATSQTHVASQISSIVTLIIEGFGSSYEYRKSAVEHPHDAIVLIMIISENTALERSPRRLPKQATSRNPARGCSSVSIASEKVDFLLHKAIPAIRVQYAHITEKLWLGFLCKGSKLTRRIQDMIFDPQIGSNSYFTKKVTKTPASSWHALVPCSLQDEQYSETRHPRLSIPWILVVEFVQNTFTGEPRNRQTVSLNPPTCTPLITSQQLRQRLPLR